jgi:dTDP-4-amino-4,6-dideoxygalactose transaminase
MIPFLDLRTQYQAIRSEILEAVTATLDSGTFVLGPEVAAFEEAFAPYAGASHAVGVNSGTAALQLALVVAGIGPDDEVITVPHTFVATVAAIMYVGARPVLVDIDPASYTLDPSCLEAAIGPRTKAIIPVHLYGQPADMDPIMDIARRHGLMVVEDAAQAHGAEYKGRRCGGIGDLAAFSFYPGKNLGAYGEGGAITTNREDYARTLRMLRDWGQETKYEHKLLGYNARLESIQASVLRVKMRHIDRWTAARRSIAERYDAGLAGLRHVLPPAIDPDRRHVFHIYAVRVRDRQGFMTFLGGEGVGTAIHYPFAVHTLEGYRTLGYQAGEFPIAEMVASEVVSLPMFPEMTDGMVDAVIAAVRKYDASA